jgi:hypothetical protein
MKKNSKEYLDKIVDILEKPYFREMGYYGIVLPKEQMDILSKIYGFNIKFMGVTRKIYNCSDQLIYVESYDGKWEIREFDNNGNLLYLGNSTGYWEKRKYNSGNEEIYYENSTGYIFLNQIFSIYEKFN